MDIEKITNVLIFKDGFYYLTIGNKEIEKKHIELDMPYGSFEIKEEIYMIVPEEWGLNNGFEFASDAYSYLSHLQHKEKV